MNYATKHMNATQQEQDRSDQVQNNAGGFVFEVDKWSRLRRFLVLGAEGGSFYVGERKLVRENAVSLLECIKEDARKVVDTLVEFSVAGRAPSQQETFFAMAMVLAETKGADRRYASEAIPKICRTGSHILEMASTFTQLTGRRVGSSRALAAGFKQWYEDKSASSLCYQTTKYPQRAGWTHGDLIRAVHPKPSDEVTNKLFAHLDEAVTGVSASELLPYEELEYLHTKTLVHAAESKADIVKLLEAGKATWEIVPTQWLNEPEVWDVLLEKGVPMTALMRNLGRLSKIGLIKPLSAAERQVCVQLTNPEAVQKARLHPYNVLVAQATYASGRGFRGGSSWPVSQEVVEALEATFEAAFGNLEPTGKRYLLGLDVSGSMGSRMRNGPLSCRESSGAMAMVTKRLEEQCYVHGFSTGFVDLRLTRKDSYKDVINKISGLPFQGTDCAIPMLWAGNNKIEVDAFVVYTDSETWHGDVHPYRALKAYRQAMGIDARLVVVGMEGNRFSIADPNDPGMLDVVGFDSSAPRIIGDFTAGRI